ncbi:MAG: histidine--tRNA ligase [Planctomycetota bacterium]
MAKNTLRAIEGTRDLFGADMDRYEAVLEAGRTVFGRYGYAAIATPIFEDTRLFQRSLGEDTDIVEKEMYTFKPGSDTITLRPEGTAGVIRALLQHNLHREQGFWKLWYAGPMFRRERPQKGRYRQFHQIGVEAVGSNDPLLDAECIRMALDFFTALGLGDVRIRINSIGCMKPECRPAFQAKLRAAVEPELSRFCPNCQNRFGKNLLRILDCKNPRCRAIRDSLPRSDAHLCAECARHDRSVEEALTAGEIPFARDPFIVRGLDYYTRSVFEFTHESLGAQDAICGGGRYDGLVEKLGGPSLPAVGFAVGLDRVMIALEEKPVRVADAAHRLQVYGVAVGDAPRKAMTGILARLRAAGLSADMDFEGKSLKAQMKKADRTGAAVALILGEEELSSGTVALRDMREGAQTSAALPEIKEAVLRLLSRQSPVERDRSS